ncbi:energy transducer TonB [Brevundimonas sp.]|uniref:energy transducer TonB n=1 Tax=Brevundimonas sp. TaxID=1871086 RepID=UPI002737FDC2|nr:energy transducer TonB [Brevundimonas sp.]MDP3801645.1 energy transducer TonB [Brevundimonas sp.]
MKPEPPLLNADRLRKLGIVVGVSLAHLAVFAVMGRPDAPEPVPAQPPPFNVVLYRPPPPPPPPLPVVRSQGGGAPAAPSRVHLTPKPADKPRELVAPPVPAPVPDPVLVGAGPIASPTPGMGQGGEGTGSGGGRGDGFGPGSGGAGPMILRGATQGEILSIVPPAARAARRAGRASVNCVIRLDQRLDDCRVVSESPEGFGFGEAGVRAAAFFRYRPPMTAAGRPVEGQRVTVFILMGRQ